MRAYGHLSEEIETEENFAAAEYYASRRKKRRKEVQDFRNDPESLKTLLHLYSTESYQTSEYTYKSINERGKTRFLSMLPYPDHVFHWAMLLKSEPILARTLDGHSYASIPGRGQHLMVHTISDDIFHAGDKIRYFLNGDVSKMYASIPIRIPKKHIRKKIKDPRLLRHFDTVIESSIGTPMGMNDHGEDTGVPIGLKISTVIANISLCYFDHDVRRCFGIAENDALMDFLAGQYVSEKFVSARSESDLKELSKGVQYLSEKFKGFVREGIRYYYRFMDNFVVLHEDKTFLHILLDWMALYLSSELRLTLNPKWQVGNLIDGLPIVGYRIYADGHVRVAKNNKIKAIRHIRKGFKLGLSQKEVRQHCSSYIGTIKHANSINLLRKYNMETKKERLGAKINRRRSQCPFDMSHDQQRRFEAVLFYPESGPEDDYLMELRDFAVQDSIKEFYDEEKTKPKPCLAIRYEWQGKTLTYRDDKGREVVIEKGKEYYSFTGSKILIEQAMTEFTREDLPAPTVIRVQSNKRNKKFYKFT